MKAHLEKLAAEANRGCGLSYELFVDRFSAAVDVAYPQSSPNRAAALELATPMGYETPEERAAAHEERAEDGYCRHGIERNCCPAGCGDIE
jgi:hypothetical protein